MGGVSLPLLPFFPPTEEEASGEDEAEVLTRAALKHQAQQILDAHGPRRPRARHKDPKA